MDVYVDRREKARAIVQIIAEFDKQGINHIPFSLHVGDYQNIDKPRLAIDRKQNLSELCSNVCQQHERFINELKRANNAHIKLIILCEHGPQIKTLEDVNTWYNPRLKQSPMAVSGQRLFKILYSISKKYDVDFEFCTKAQTGKRIIEILGGGENDRLCKTD